MNKVLKYAIAAVVALNLGLMAIPAMGEGADGQSTLSSNPIGETIDKTASIKEMQSKPARAQSYSVDMFGNKIPSQTDNSGKR